MINAFGNYIGFGNPQFPPLKTNGFISQTNLTDDIGLLTIFFDANNPNPLNGTGSFEFNSEKEVEYLIVGAGGYGGQVFSEGLADQTKAGAGGGGGGIVSGSAILEADKTYTAIVGAPRNLNSADGSVQYAINRGGDSYLVGHDETLYAFGGGNGGFVDSYAGLDVPTSGSNGGSGGGGGVGDQLATFDENPGSFIQGTGQFKLGTVGASGSYFGTQYSTPNGYAYGTTYAALVNSNRVANSYLTGAYTEVYLPGGGGGAGQSGSMAQITTGVVGTVNYFEITSSFKGGDGVLSSINNVSTYYAGGGGAMTFQSSNAAEYVTGSWATGSGGLGGGGNAFTTGSNLLGGGGGAGGNAGGTGVIYIRYALNQRNLIR